jgi:hypothetical protein
LPALKDSKDWPLESKDDKKEQMKILLSDKEADEVTMNFLKAYQDTIAANAITALTASELDDPTDKGKAKAAQGFVRSQLSPEDKERKEKQDEFWEKETGGTKTRFKLTDKERFAEIDTDIAKQIAAHWDEYIGSLKPGSRSFRAGYFKPIHMAQRLGSGLGSRGVMKVYILIEGEADTTKDDNVVLEAKATSTPVEVKTGALSAPQITGGEAKRVSDATRAMTARTDDHEGRFNAAGFPIT